jgi:hypothetical protein
MPFRQNQWSKLSREGGGKPMVFKRTLSYIEEYLSHVYNISSTIRHKGERGRQRENGLASFLTETLPLAYGVASGEIISFRSGRVSPQTDVIIYDALHFPVLGRGSPVQQIPLEAVFCAVESKSIIDGAALSETTRKFAEIRALPRCKARERPRKGCERERLFVLFGYRLAVSTTRCKAFLEETSHNQDTILVALGDGCCFWVSECRRPVWISGCDLGDTRYMNLAFFFGLLLELMGQIDLGRPRYMRLVLGR